MKSERTKSRMAASLKDLMTIKPISKITIGEITKACDLNRQTFYYHFEDIYDLLRWIFNKDVEEIFLNFTCTGIADRFNLALDYIEENRAMIKCIVKSMDYSDLRAFFYDYFYEVISFCCKQDIDTSGFGLREDYYQYAIRFYASSMENLLFSWVNDEINLSREEFTELVTVLINNTIDGVMNGIKDIKKSDAN